MEIQMEYYLIVSAVMFFAGVYGFITRRNLIAVLISIELILNAVDINFAVFNVADMCIVSGAVLGAVYYVYLYEKHDRRKPNGADDAAGNG